MKRTGSQFQCLECGEHFISPDAFGRHFRRDTPQCQTPDELRASGMVRNRGGFWLIPLSPPDYYIGFENGGPGEPA